MKTTRFGARRAFAAALVGAIAFSANSAAAQSRYGCSELEGAFFPSIEGENGVFFRIDPDLLSYNAMSDDTVADVAALSESLAARGTTLVFVPLPTKALAMPDALGAEAEVFAYDVDLAATIYQDQIARISDAGVAAIDVRRALLGAERAFFEVDPRMTNEGLRLLATAIAANLEDWPASEGPGYVTRAGGPVVLPSLAQDTLQLSCLSDLPLVADTSYETLATAADYAMDEAAQVVFAGPSQMTDPALNLAGFLSEVSGERVAVLGGETAFSALSAYLTSDTYRQSPPEVLIWAVPVSESLADSGDQPFREALAAVEDVCVADLDTGVAGPNRLRVALGEALAEASDTLMLDNSALASNRAVFHFVALDGQTRSRAVVRPLDVAQSGRFYMPLSGLWEDGVAYVDIETPLGNADLPVVALCRGRA